MNTPVEFQSLGLNPNILSVLDKEGFREPTEIQLKAIPLLLDSEMDFVGQAQTGTGKTAAFVLPLLQNLDIQSRKVQGIILTPTRELANQVGVEVDRFGSALGVQSLTICGGKDYDAQLKGLRKDKPQLVIGTPGRVIDLIKRKALRLDGVENLILDEADEMLNMGFIDDVKFVLSQIKRTKNVWMFSATMPKAIQKLIEEELNRPKFVQVEKKTLSNESIHQSYYVVKKKNRNEALSRIISSNEDFYGMVFCTTKRETVEVSEFLNTRGFQVETLHGDMNQSHREIAMNRFKAGVAKILTCTDVAARGLDVNKLTHVINYGLPREVESYIHRIGRTGRAGLTGSAIAIIQPTEFRQLQKIQRTGRCEIHHAKFPDNKELKAGRVRTRLRSMERFLEAVEKYGDDFKVDATYRIFDAAFDGMSKDDVLRVVFSHLFCNELKRINDVGAIDEENFSASKSGGDSSFKRNWRKRGRPQRGQSTGRSGQGRGKPRKSSSRKSK